MISITIEPADNGIVKVIYDDSVNGAGEEYISRKVYDFEKDSVTKDSVVDFLTDIILDLGIEVGTKLDKYKVSIVKQWGDVNLHSEEAIKKRVKDLESELKTLRSKIKK